MKKHLEKARALLDSKKPEDLPHACLELRMAIEAHVYNKLRYFSKKHGDKLLFKNWQPDKAIKVLMQLEPRADMTYTLSVAKEDESGEPEGEFLPLGTHQALSHKWIRKNYHKLGNYLHLNAKTGDSPAPTAESIESIYEKLLEASHSNLISDFGIKTVYTCRECSSAISCSTERLPDLDLVYCPNPSCSASYLLVEKDGRWGTTPNAIPFTCPDCETTNFEYRTNLEIGHKINCSGCTNIFEIKNVHFELKKNQS